MDAEDRKLLEQYNRHGKRPLDLSVDEHLRAATRNVWEASARLDVTALKALLFAHVPGRGDKKAPPVTELDIKTARSGFTPLHMAVKGTGELLRDAKGRARVEAQMLGKRTVFFLMDHEAFVDSLDKLCR